MNINKKIIGLLVISFFLTSAVLTFDSINGLKKSQTENIGLFKTEFLELGRETFNQTSNLFFYSLDSKIISLDKPLKQGILDIVKEVNDNGSNVVVFDTTSKKILEDYNFPDITSVVSPSVLQVTLEQYLQENTLNQKTDFDLDNFTEFSTDQTSLVVPKKIHFKVYRDAGLIVGFGETFLSVKTRIGFIERQNLLLFNSQLYFAMEVFVGVLVLMILLLVIFMRRIILNPLNKIVEVVKEIAAGDLTKQVVVKSRDEIGQLGTAFNEMASKLKTSYGVLESKIEERTKELEAERGSLEKKVEERTMELEGLKNNLEKTVTERTDTLNSKVLELERMNDLMLGRELKMIELKNEIKKLKNKG